MKPYTKKVATATAVVIALSVLAAATLGVLAAVVVFLIGALNIAERHLDRCYFCGSWRLRVKEDWHPDDNAPRWMTVTGYRTCQKCGVQEIDHFLLRDPNPLHPS